MEIIPKAKKTCLNVIIDESLGRDSTFTFSWEGSSDTKVTLSSPQGRSVVVESTDDANSAGYWCRGYCEVSILGYIST